MAAIYKYCDSTEVVLSLRGNEAVQRLSDARIRNYGVRMLQRMAEDAENLENSEKPPQCTAHEQGRQEPAAVAEVAVPSCSTAGPSSRSEAAGEEEARPSSSESNIQTG